MMFGEGYTKYWSFAVNKSVDGTIIAGVNEAKNLLQYLKIKRDDRTLDLGCSFGRMHEALAGYSDQIFGLELDPYAVEKARSQPYKEVRQGAAEHTGFDQESFDVVFCWAVFDVVDHKKGLAEINRILKNGGKLLLTGKNDNYLPDDQLAYKAEKNAFLKAFPNKFTDLSSVLGNFQHLGFKLDKLLTFPYRGDLGLLNFVDQGNDLKDNYLGYEYLIICHKDADPNVAELTSVSLEGRFSKTAIKMAAQAGFLNTKDFFESIGID
jgi:SAM-dependent methyltransferase